MTPKRFNAIVADRCKKIEQNLASKGSEYARGDRLSNFKRAGDALGSTPEAACVGFWMKHVISVCDLVNDLRYCKVASYEMWQEKIGDAMNYLVLLEGLLDDRFKDE